MELQTSTRARLSMLLAAAIWLTCIATTTGSGGVAGALCYAAPGGLAGRILSGLSGGAAGNWFMHQCVKNYCRG